MISKLETTYGTRRLSGLIAQISKSSSDHTRQGMRSMSWRPNGRKNTITPTFFTNDSVTRRTIFEKTPSFLVFSLLNRPLETAFDDLPNPDTDTTPLRTHSLTRRRLSPIQPCRRLSPIQPEIREEERLERGGGEVGRAGIQPEEGSILRTLVRKRQPTKACEKSA